ncbi:MAG TPA: glycoside hydrolase family 2 protein [Bacteroidales bacterium]|nr:glycoside hydrolase family 2 protein [Bacteroidales bacterium]
MRALFFIVLSILPFVLNSCKKEEISYAEIEINSNWELRSSDDSIQMEATVPGTLLGDLFRNEEIENPYIADNVNTLQWIDQKEWVYSTTFDVPKAVLRMNNVSLSIGQIKGTADVVLNDSLLGTIHGYFDDQVFKCKNKLKVRGNKLLIKFKSVSETSGALANDTTEDKLPISPFPAVFQGTSVSPQMLSCGIFEPVKLIAWSGARIRNVFVYTDSIKASEAIIQIKSELESVKEANYEVEIYVNNQKIDKAQVLKLRKGIQKYQVQISIPNPELWWCNGMGKPAIYELTFVLKRNKKLFDEKKITFGIRKVEFTQLGDSVYSTPHLILNGQPVFIKGANYLPVNLYQLEHNTGNYEQLISKAAAANLNLLRVWGGGVYEKKLFYDLCDKYGIMVWQDIAIPGQAQIIDKSMVPVSVIQNIEALRNHPSVVLFYTAMEQMNTLPPLSLKKNDRGLVKADSLLAEIIKRKSPNIPYCSQLQALNSGSRIQSFWPVWYNSSTISTYSQRKKGIVTEFGVQSVPDIKTALTFDSDDDFDLRSPVTDAHQFTNINWMGSQLNGNQMLGTYLQMYYNDPVNSEALVYLSQVFQSEALKFAIANFRVNKPSCMGSIFWHFNDCWPAISWSVVDFYNRNKPAYYTVRKAYQNIAVVPERNGDMVKLWIVNDSLAGLKGNLSFKILDFNGAELFQNTQEVDIKANSSSLVYEKYASAMFPNKISNKVLMYVTLSVQGKVIADNILYFVDPMFLDLPEPDINMQITNKNSRFQVILRSSTLVKNLVLFTRDKESFFTDNNIDLLPGVTYTITADYDGTQTDFENDLQIISLVDSF